MPVKKSLRALRSGVLALALAACSQSSEPEEALEPLSPSVEEVVADAKPAARPTRRAREENVELPSAPVPALLPAAPVLEEELPAPAPEPLPAAESVIAPAPVPVVEPVVVASPFVPVAPGKRIAQVSVPGPYVAVTFDDGPSATLTPQVLDIFKRHGARATFFVLGKNAALNRGLLARAVAEGHEVGSHTWSHLNMRASNPEKIFSELDRTRKLIEEVTGSSPKVMRPPYGSVNKNLVDMVYERYGTPAILWDVDTNDWRKPGVEKVVGRAVNKARPGSIILLHDIHPSTIAAVEDIVIGLQARGFKLVTVSQLIEMGCHAAGVTPPTAPSTLPVAEPCAEGGSMPPHAQHQPEGAASIGGAPVPVEPSSCLEADGQYSSEY